MESVHMRITRQVKPMFDRLAQLEALIRQASMNIESLSKEMRRIEVLEDSDGRSPTYTAAVLSLDDMITSEWRQQALYAREGVAIVNVLSNMPIFNQSGVLDSDIQALLDKWRGRFEMNPFDDIWTHNDDI